MTISDLSFFYHKSLHSLYCLVFSLVCRPVSLIIEAILQTVKNDMRSTSLPQLTSEHPLRGKVIHYDDPYEPVAAKDWEALTINN